MKTRKTTVAVLVAGCFGPALALADDAKVMSPVVVTATRVEQDSFDLPMSIDQVGKENIQDAQLRMTLSESLVRVPGITAQSRNQMAQDPQISTRGFGARSAFGVRGIRLFIDGIPLSMPDGIGNPGNIDLSTIGSIEVLRGPFSTMYGNSSGGVIQLLSDKAPATPEISADVAYGSFDTRRSTVQAAGTKNGVEYSLTYTDFSSNGFREQSASSKQSATARLRTNIGEDARLTTLISWFDQNAQDPGGLRRTALTDDPSAFTTPTGTAATQKLVDARVARDNTQIGFNFEKTINANNALNLIAYGGKRNNNQILYVANIPSYNSRASVIDRNFYGTELRLTNRGQFLDKPYTLIGGIAFGQMQDDRLDINADNGVVRPAVDANFNRNEAQTATNFDQYVQGSLAATDRLDFHAGLRHTNVDMKFRDRQVDPVRCAVAATRRYCDTSGDVSYERTTPAIGATFKATPLVNLYANFGKAFETPTLVEVSFLDASAGTGPNLGLKPSTSDNFEIGAKALVGDNARLNAAYFDIRTENEIIVNSTVSGRTSYQNGKSTRRNGFELSYEAALTSNLTAFAAYSLLNAQFDEGFTNSNGTVAKDNRIPGTYRTQLYGEIAWRYQPANLRIAVEGRHNSKAYVNDTNTDAAPSYTIFNLRASMQQEIGRWKITEYVRVENIFDKDYIGSVRVNDYTNQRYFEPAPGRNYIAGVKANYMF